eukprot:PhM_4_TR7169/c0_g1_i1/m.18599
MCRLDTRLYSLQCGQQYIPQNRELSDTARVGRRSLLGVLLAQTDSDGLEQVQRRGVRVAHGVETKVVVLEVALLAALVVGLLLVLVVNGWGLVQHGNSVALLLQSKLDLLAAALHNLTYPSLFFNDGHGFGCYGVVALLVPPFVLLCSFLRDAGGLLVCDAALRFGFRWCDSAAARDTRVLILRLLRVLRCSHFTVPLSVLSQQRHATVLRTMSHLKQRRRRQHLLHVHLDAVPLPLGQRRQAVVRCALHLFLVSCTPNTFVCVARRAAIAEHVGSRQCVPLDGVVPAMHFVAPPLPQTCLLHQLGVVAVLKRTLQELCC